MSIYNNPVRGSPLDSPRNLVDIDGDGLIDFVGLKVRPDVGTTSSAYRSRGDGNFDAAAVGVVCDYPMDFNGDGRNDCLRPGGAGVASNNALLVASGGTSSLTAVADFNLKSAGQELAAADTRLYIVDLNGDGRHDILRWKDDPTQTVVYVSNGNGTFTQSTYFNLNTATRQLKKSDGSVDVVAGDFTGRGSIEFLRLKASPTAGEATSNQLYERADKTPPDQLISVVSPSGLTTALIWVPLSNSYVGSSYRYIPDRGVSGVAASYPKLDLNVPMYVVASSTSDTGLSAGISSVTTEYSYTGLKAGFDGRGLKGFRETRRQGPGPDGTPITVVTQHLQDHPYLGVASKTETYVGAFLGKAALPANPTSASIFTYCDKTSLVAETSASSTVPCAVTARMQRPYLYKSVESGRDLNGAVLPVVTTVNTFDNAGNPTNIAITTSGTALGLAQTFTKTTSNVYLPDQTSGDTWVLGRLQQASQRNTAPNSLSSIATSAGSAPTAAATQGTGPLPPISPAVLSAILQLLLED